MKILYFSCHEILEYDEIRIFRHAGHQVYSIGSYTLPGATGHFRHLEPDDFRIQMWNLSHETGCDLSTRTISATFADHFDAFVIMHDFMDYARNRDVLRGRKVFIRTIGQSYHDSEKSYMEFQDEVKIVRYSEKERRLPARTDAVIYFGKFMNETKEWCGDKPGLTFHNDFRERSFMGCPNVEDWIEFQRASGCRLLGDNNETVPGYHGMAMPDEMADLYASAAFYMFCYTIPPSYTLSVIEAMMAGVPIIAPSATLIEKTLSPALQNALWTPERYELPDLLRNGGGFLYDSIAEAAYIAGKISSDKNLMRHVSMQARAMAVKTFCATKAALAWNSLFSRN